MATDAPTPVPSGMKHPYHLVDPSPWPIVGAASAGLLVFGMIELMHFKTAYFLYLGLASVLATMFLWWPARWPGPDTGNTRS